MHEGNIEDVPRVVLDEDPGNKREAKLRAEHRRYFYDAERQEALNDWELPSTTESIKFAVEEVEQRLVLAGWSEAEAYLLSLAFNEALANAIAHGNLGIPTIDTEKDPTASIGGEVRKKLEADPELRDVKAFVHVEISGEKVLVTVRDQGRGFPYGPDNIPQPTKEENITKPLGRGLYLISQSFDEYQWEEGGNEIRMIKYRHAEEQSVR